MIKQYRDLNAMHFARDRKFLSCDAMHKHNLCCGPVSVRLSVCLSRSCILSRWL